MLLLSLSTLGHGAMTFPKPRQSLDGAIPPWSNWSYPHDKIHFCYDGKTCAGACPISAHSGVPGHLNASNGQSCYWFSNGCTVGCDVCDGTHNHVGHGNQSFLYKGMNGTEIRKKNLTIDVWSPTPGDMVLDPKTLKGLEIKPNCANPKQNATICDPRLRTTNTQAECGGPADIYFWSPWRAPGAAPVIDACGTAGGRHPGQGDGQAGAIFQNSSLAKQGDLGSKLPQMPPQATWQAGGIAEVGWTVMANHGGGYSYRLSPADEPLTEENFRRTPLDFTGLSVLRWDGDHETQLPFDSEARGWQTRVGTTPEGSMWRKSPIPGVLWERMGPSFEPVCEESDECKRGATQHGGGAYGICKCSGHSNAGPLLPNLEIVDTLTIPKGLKPGNYVLQFRWDCEETDQVWLSCSDVKIE